MKVTDRNKTLPTEKYQLKIRPYLKGILNDLKTFDMWKIQLIRETNLFLLEGV